MACNYLSELRLRLQGQLGFLLRESSRPDLADFVGPGRYNVRVDDQELLALGCLGTRGRAGLAARLGAALGATPGPKVADFRPLWLQLECVIFRGTASRLGLQALRKAWQGLDRIYEKEALAGAEQALQGHPRLAQWALLAGGLEREELACKT